MARPRAWGTTFIDEQYNVANTETNFNLLAELTPSDTITAMRILVHVIAVPQNLSDNIDGGTVVDMGIGVASLEAFTAGVLPNVNVAGEVPARGWLWRDRLIAVGNSVTGPPVHDVYFGTEVHADLRAMRKVDRGVLYLSTRSSDIKVSGTYLPLALVGIVRVLCAT